MSLVPAFEIGIWNAWIFMVAWVFFHLIPLPELILINKYKHIDIKGFFKKSSDSPQYNKTEKKINNLGTIVWFIMLIYSIFLPLPLGTSLLYTGIAFFLLGLIICKIIGITWAKTDIDKPVTTGLYRYSRHPVYIAVFVQYIGIGIASASGLFLLLTVVSIILSILVVPAEERFCLDKYGDTYREYLNRTPRWIGLPKS